MDDTTDSAHRRVPQDSAEMASRIAQESPSSGGPEQQLRQPDQVEGAAREHEDTALAEINAAVAKAGHPQIRYRLYKVTGKQAGDYNYMWEGAFPSGAVYDAVHKSPAFCSSG